METRERARLLAGGRIIAGTALLVAPTLSTKPWIGSAADRSGARVLARGLGIRDMVIGLGLLMAVRRGAPVRGWLEAGVTADVVDCFGVGLTAVDGPLPGRLGVAVAAAAGAVEGVRLARVLEQEGANP